MKYNRLKLVYRIILILPNYRKQKQESEKIKDSLDYIFNREVAINELKDLLATTEIIDTNVSERLLFFIRKFELNFDDLNSVNPDFTSKIIQSLLEDNNNAAFYALSLALKYSSRNTSNASKVINCSNIVDLIKKLDPRSDPLTHYVDDRVEKELFLTLGDLIEKLDSDKTKEIRRYYDEARSFLSSKIEPSRTFHNYGNKKMSQNQGGKNSKLVATKCLQMAKENLKNEKIYSITKVLKRKIIPGNIIIKESSEPEIETKGSDQSLLRCTWEECNNLFNIAFCGGEIKIKDEDYLQEKFLNKSAHYISLLESEEVKNLKIFLNNRMIAATFSLISKKQTLGDKTIEKLVNCIVDLKSLIKDKLCLLYSYDSMVKISEGFVTECLKNKEKFNEPVVSHLVKQFVDCLINSKNHNDSCLNDEIKKIDGVSVKEVIIKEIQKLRLDACNALYESVNRDISILTKPMIQQIQTFFDNHNFNEDCDEELIHICFKLLNLVDFNENIDYNSLFDTQLKKLESSQNNVGNEIVNENVKTAIEFINSQSKDFRRCEKLFNFNIIEKLINFTSNSKNDEMKFMAIQTVNNYLKLKLDKREPECLNEKMILGIVNDVIECNDISKKLLEAALFPIFVTTKVKNFLPEAVKTELIKNMEKYPNYIAWILNLARSDHIKNENDLEMISKYLNNEYVVVDSDYEIKFEKCSDSNSKNSKHVSLICCELIFDSIENKIKITNNTIHNLLNARFDTDTRICAAKCVDSFSSYFEFEGPALNLIKDQFDDEINDVTIHIYSAYTRALFKLADKNSPIDDIHLETLSSLMVLQGIEEDFVDKINQNILRTFKHVAKNYKIKGAFFNALEEIFNYKIEKYVEQALDILGEYTKIIKEKKSLVSNTIPETTISALENMLSYPEYYEKAICVLQNAIRNGQMVSYSVLQTFISNLYIAENSVKRLDSFIFLFEASKNQDFANDLFFKIELQRASYALPRITTDKSSIFNFILKQTDNGILLPLDVMKQLESDISGSDNMKIVEILLKATQNKQILKMSLVNELESLFNPNEYNSNLLDIFKILEKNNQLLSNDLLRKLEESLDIEEKKKQVLEIFLVRGQKGEKLSSTIIEKILKQIEKTDLIFKQECLNSLASIIQMNKDNFIKHEELFNLLEAELESENINIKNICINIWKALKDNDIWKVKPGNRYLNKMINICTDCNQDETVKKNIYELLKKFKKGELEEEIQVKIELANLTFSSNNELFEKIKECLNNGGDLLEENCNQLANIINEDSSNSHEVIKFLSSKEFQNKMSEDLIKSIIFLSKRTNSVDIKKMCNKVLTNQEKRHFKHNEDGKIDLEIKESTIFESEFSKNKFKLNYSEVEALLIQLKIDPKLLNDLTDMNELLNHILHENCVYFYNPSFVELIENILQEADNQKFYENALKCYSRIIKEKKAKKLVTIFKKQIEYQKKVNLGILPWLIECIYSAIKISDQSSAFYELLRNNIMNQNEFIRGLSFKGLRLAANIYSYKKDLFIEYCESALENWSAKIGHKLSYKNDIDILEVIFSIKYVDLDVFKKKPKVWIKELIISNLFKFLKATKAEQLEFYTNWLQIEQRFGIEKSIGILVLLQQRLSLNISKSFSVINETISCMINSKYDDILSRFNEIDLQQSFKLFWCIQNIKDRLVNESVNEEYLVKLAKEVIKVDFKFIQKMFQCVSEIQNLNDFESSIEFFTDTSKFIQTIDLGFKNVSFANFKTIIEAKHIQYKLKATNDSNVFIILFNLLDKKWTFGKLSGLISTIECSNPLNSSSVSIHVLNIINQFNLSPSKYQECKNILNSKEPIKELNKLVVEDKFQLKDKIKNQTKLLSELQNSSSNNQKLSEYVNNGLQADLESVKSESIASKILKKGCPIFKWSKTEIKEWSEKVKKTKDKLDIVEGLAVVKRANFLLANYNLTDIQIICCLISVKCEQNLLFQVATGDGKSTIVCILAIIIGLKNKVNVITSTSVLAERDSKQNNKLYEIFGLKCSCNTDKVIYRKGFKDCYKADIVYGEISQFQFDKLRHEYSELGTLGKRKCETIIIDEVDSILIDDSSKISRLSSTVSGIDHFQHVFVFLWYKILSIKKRFTIFKGKMYFLKGIPGFENGKIILEFTNENSENIKIVDLEEFINQNEEKLNQIGEAIYDDIEDFLRKQLDISIKEGMKVDSIVVPINFKDYYEKQLPKWISNAIEAFNYHEDIHYVVQDGQIKPVDYYSTGIVQNGTTWSDGLHQFLQIKHNLKMTCETLTTNFMSNVGFIKSHNKVFGFTATLGSEKGRNVLKSVYNVELVNIPRQYEKQYFEYPVLILQNENKWVEEICAAVLLENKKDRGVLIICETISQANDLGNKLKIQLRPSAIKLYTMNNKNEEKIIEKLLPGEIIIATNLAGRGTDIKTDAIEDFGGMHVILTFLPNNQRVEEQAFGRTSRQGKRGTGQMILNSENLTDVKNKDFKKQRDDLESKQLDDFVENELKSIEMKDKLFKEFCSFLNEKRKEIRKKNNGIFQNVKECFTDVIPTVYEQNILAAIEEKWAMFLLNIEDSKPKFEEFIQSLQNDYEKNEIIKNPYHNIVIGNHLIFEPFNTNYLMNYSNSNLNKKAEENFENAANLLKSRDEYYYGAVHAGLVCCGILNKESKFESILKSFFKEESSKDRKSKKMKKRVMLKKALISLTNERAQLNSIQLILQKFQQGFLNSELDKQFNVKSKILDHYFTSIQNCDNVIMKSLRLIDLVKKYGQEEELFFDYERHKDDKNISLKLDEKADYDLIFNNLTAREDSGSIDQAKNTIDQTFKKGELSDSYNDITFRLNRVGIESINSLLDQNKLFHLLAYDDALTKLEDERTFLEKFRKSVFVDLIIINKENNLETIFENKKIKEIIEIIKKNKPDTNLRYNIKIKDVNINYINSCLETNPSAEVTFIKVDSKRVSENLELFIKSNYEFTANIEMVLFQKHLLNFLNEPNESKKELRVKICLTKNNNSKKIIVGNANLLSELNKHEKDVSFQINFQKNSPSNAKHIVDYFKDSIFDITFNTRLKNLKIFLEERLWQSSDSQKVEINVCFNKLNQLTAKEFLKVLRKENFEICLEFKNLKGKRQVELIIKNADLEQEELEISKVKNIEKLFMKNTLPTFELNQFAACGIEYLVEINEKAFIPWRSIIIVATLGILQIIVGGILIATGVGATIGMSLITEGITDMLTAYTAYSTRHFSWSDYAIQKVISLTISLVSAGASNVVGAFQTILINSSANLNSLVPIYIGVKACEAIGQKVLNSGVKYMTNIPFELLKTEICSSIQNKVRQKFSEPKLNQLLCKLYAKCSKTFDDKMNQIVNDIMNPKRSNFNKLWNSIGLPLLKGILSTSNQYGKAISMIFRISGTLNGLKEMWIIIDNFHNTLCENLEKLQINSFTNNFDKIDLDSFSITIKYISDRITDQIVNVAKTQLIQPWSTLAVSSLTDHLSTIIQNDFITHDETTVEQQIYKLLNITGDIPDSEVDILDDNGDPIYDKKTEQIFYDLDGNPGYIGEKWTADVSKILDKIGNSKDEPDVSKTFICEAEKLLRSRDNDETKYILVVS